jgi:DNA-directed RNA polymerase specialized sigma24 family protein
VDGLFTTLDTEWQQLQQRRGTRSHYRRWQDNHPVFADYASLEALMTAARRRDDPATADRILAALAARSAEDDLAARTLLQAILPGLRTLAATHHWLAPADDLEASLVALAWQHIRHYPVHTRPRRIAANLLLDTGHHLRREHLRARHESPSDIIGTEHGTTKSSAAEELTALVVRAVTLGNLRPETASLILRTRVLDEGVDDIAQRLGYPTDTIRHRRRRAERTLKATA